MFSVTYGPHIVSGKLIPSEFTQTAPKIKITMRPDTLYTIYFGRPGCSDAKFFTLAINKY